MVRTRVGYAGGHKINPTYYGLGDHSESIELEFDPAQISYEALLNLFWQSHRPTRKAYNRQYMSAIFYHTPAQQEVAERTKAEQAKRLGSDIFTEVAPYTRFYLAEDYHQKYSLQQTAVIANEYRRIYPNLTDFINSTAVARANAYVGSYGTINQLNQEIATLGLSPAAQKELQRITQRYNA